MSSTLLPLRHLSRHALLGVIISCAPLARADFWDKLFPHEVDVITVTDMTEAGRAVPAATLAEPVYYMIYDLGETNFGPTWAGDVIPKPVIVRRWMMAAMAGQGYLLADETHPPTQFFVYGWGMLQGGAGRPALKFLGGDKADLMWEQEQQYGGFVNSRVLLRGLQRVGIVGQIWDFAEADLYLGIVRSYTMESIRTKQPVKLWETRFGCPATGLNLAEAMPLMVKAAARNLGRETALPVNVNASQEFGGRVDYGDLKIIGTVPAQEMKAPKTAPAGSR